MADIVTPKPPGIIRSWSNHLQGTLREPDGHTPSSARMLATAIVIVMLLLQIVITLAVLMAFIALDTSHANAPALANTYAQLLRVIVLFGFLFDIATALSFYGINVWKYISTFANPLAAAAGAAGALGGVVSGALKTEAPKADTSPADPDKIG